MTHIFVNGSWSTVDAYTMNGLISGAELDDEAHPIVAGDPYGEHTLVAVIYKGVMYAIA